MIASTTLTSRGCFPGRSAGCRSAFLLSGWSIEPPAPLLRKPFRREDGCDVVFTWGEQSNCREALRRKSCCRARRSPCCMRDTRCSQPGFDPRTAQPCADDRAGVSALPGLYCVYLRRMEQLHVKMGRKALAQDAASMLLMLESGAGITVGPQGAFQEKRHLVARTIEGCGEFGSWRALFSQGEGQSIGRCAAGYHKGDGQT